MHSVLQLRRSKTTVMTVVAVAELVCGLIFLLLGYSGPQLRPAVPGRSVAEAPASSGGGNGRPQPATPVTPPAGATKSSTVPGSSTTTDSVPSAPAAGSGAPSVSSPPTSGAPPAAGSGSSATIPSAPPPSTGPSTARTATPSVPPGTATSQPIACQTDLALAQAPDTGYDFLCQQGSRPVTWGKNALVFYDQGLNPLQEAAFAVAIAQWEAVAHFSVTYTSNPQAADVVVTDVPLGTGQPGYSEDGYTTNSYRCSPQCSYYHSDVKLSSTATLTQTDWVSTVLHELGHLAGLNHVSKAGEVMYPYLTLSSPVAYAAGDRAGLAALAAQRGA